MKDKQIYKLWEEFINDDKYKEFMMTPKEQFNINLKKITFDTNYYKPKKQISCTKNILLDFDGTSSI